jgi:hypothetical protein
MPQDQFFENLKEIPIKGGLSSYRPCGYSQIILVEGLLGRGLLPEVLFFESSPRMQHFECKSSILAGKMGAILRGNFPLDCLETKEYSLADCCSSRNQVDSST